MPDFTSSVENIQIQRGVGTSTNGSSAFGASGEGHLRFAYTISREDISRGMDKTEAVLRRLRGE